MNAVTLLSRLSTPSSFGRAPFGADIAALTEAVIARGGPVLYVARDDRTSIAALKLAEFFAPSMERVLIPGWDTLPYDRISPTATIAARRCAGLATLAQGQPDRPLFAVTTASSLVQRTPPLDTFRKASFQIGIGDTITQQDLTDYLSINGYVRTPTVRDRGDFAIRGGIIDLFPPTADQPVRLDFFGDTLDQMRTFDPETQRSTGNLKRTTFAPVSEIFFTPDVLSDFRTRYLETFGPPDGDPMYEAARASIRRQGVENWLPLFHESMDSLFSYLPSDSLIAFGHLALEAARERLKQAEDYFQARNEAAGEARTARVLAPGALYLRDNELEAALNAGPVVRFSPQDTDEAGLGLAAQAGRNFAPERTRPDINIFEAVAEHVKEERSKGQTVILAAWSEGSSQRLGSVLADHGMGEVPRVYSAEAAQKAGLAIANLPIEAGFERSGISLIAEQDILGDKLASPRRKRKAANFIAEAAALSQGDLIVHVDHGVGAYEGLRTLNIADAPHDCIELRYSGGDRIFLPVENIDLISRYGSEGAESSIDKLGGVGWQSRKAKAKKRILEMAEELLKIAAARALKKADALEETQGLYEEFAARFPYEETDDQLHAIADVISDLTSGRPMDRLICGDVGFGKTEVALRAAFMMAMSGKQVAIIAPTTLLARQHYKTFSERFAGWPMKVKHLSRLVPSKEATDTRAGLKSGQVDVVVGTHALLAKTIDFKRLGMLIIDEEQRFGVKHKERLKELKSDVHVLTLSATPIPRTLQMALTGIRDLSIIATPPVDRLSVRTYVTEFDDVTLREALLREKYRGGQAFFVAPRISDLDRLEAFLKEHVPEVSFIVAHGQMAPSELEDIMTAFYEGKYDVLLSTTIVEAGLDIPRANTLIIHRADRFGLAQLYQIRGRVGRSKLRAYAYFTTPRDQVITPSAEKRLNILQSLDSLGAGFQLASHDLDMRGGGNLLGDQQSGHIREVGVELYQQMLEDAVNALKEGQDEDVVDEWSPSINVGASVLIPEDYVEDLTIRMSLYRRLADIETKEGIESFAAELIDRFGPIPPETHQLLEITQIKASCKTLGISKLDAGAKGAVFTFRDDTPLEPKDLMLLVRSKPSRLRIRPDSKLVYSGTWPKVEPRMTAVKGLLKELSDMLRVTA